MNRRIRAPHPRRQRINQRHHKGRQLNHCRQRRPLPTVRQLQGRRQWFSLQLLGRVTRRRRQLPACHKPGMMRLQLIGKLPWVACSVV